MAEKLSGISILAKIEAILGNTIDGGNADASSKHGNQVKLSFESGTILNQADRVWQIRDRTLVSPGSETIDLFDLGALDIGAGAGNDALGQSLSLVEIVGILIVVETTSDLGTQLIIGGEGTAAAWNSMFNGSDSAKLGPLDPGGMLLIANPLDPAFAVADVSNHLLKLEAAGSSGDLIYSIYILGRSA